MLHILDHFGCDKPDMARSAHQVWYFVQEVLIKYGTLFTNIMSTSTVTSLYCNSRSGEMIDLFRLKYLGFFWVVLPFRAPISGPKMFLAAEMSFLSIGQFGRRFSLTMLINCVVLGLPIVLWILCARVAFE